MSCTRPAHTRRCVPVIPETSLRLRGGAVVLDARLAVPAGATAGCVVCHPHPLYGGNMHNPVVRAVADALQRAGLATLRFDFRGTGASGGVHSGGDGEVDDARAAVDALAAVDGLGRLGIAGYSFGAWIAMRLAATEARLAAVAAIAPPLAMVDAASIGSFAAPLLLVAGDRDSYCPVTALQGYQASRPDSELTILDGVDHFFSGREMDAALGTAHFLRVEMDRDRE